jgi:hypothetical protein
MMPREMLEAEMTRLRDNLRTRVDGLVSSAKVSADYAEMELLPKLRHFETALTRDGVLLPSTVEKIVTVFEALPPNTMAGAGVADARLAELEAIADAQIANFQF